MFQKIHPRGFQVGGVQPREPFEISQCHEDQTRLGKTSLHRMDPHMGQGAHSQAGRPWGTGMTGAGAAGGLAGRRGNEAVTPDRLGERSSFDTTVPPCREQAERPPEAEEPSPSSSGCWKETSRAPTMCKQLCR